MKEVNTIIIADDHPMFRSGVRIELERTDYFKVLAESGDGNETLNLIRELKPDVAILDFQMPGLNGIEIIQILKHEKSNTKIILLTMHNDRKIFLKAIDVGVDGYVLKEDAVLDIVTAVKNVINGGSFISSKLTGLLIDNFKAAKKDENIEKIAKLTSTEKEILKYISQLNSNEEIAEKMFISKRTVENQRVIISKKLDLAGAKELLKFSVKYRDCFTD